MGNQTQGGDRQNTQGQGNPNQGSKDNEIRKTSNDQGMGRDASGKQGTSGGRQDDDIETGQKAGNEDKSDSARTRNP